MKLGKIPRGNQRRHFCNSGIVRVVSFTIFLRERISTCRSVMILTSFQENQEEKQNRRRKKQLDGKKRKIQRGDTRDDEKVPEGDEYQDKEYICDLEHTAKAGSLKGEDNPKYADSDNFLNGKKCGICAIPFEGLEKLHVKSLNKQSKNFVYVCVDPACNYFMYGDCYKNDLIKDD